MAISRHTFNEKTISTAFMDELYAYLTAQASEYFTSITQDTTSTYHPITCTTAGGGTLELSRDYWKFKLGATGTVSSQTQMTSVGDSSSQSVHYALKTDNGIAFIFYYSASFPTNAGLLITKDNNGETVALLLSSMAGGTTYSAASLDTSQSILSLQLSGRNVLPSLTVLTPVCTYGLGKYCPKLYCTPYTQYTNVGTIEMSGKQYVNTGYLALEA